VRRGQRDPTHDRPVGVVKQLRGVVWVVPEQRSHPGRVADELIVAGQGGRERIDQSRDADDLVRVLVADGLAQCHGEPSCRRRRVDVGQAGDLLGLQIGERLLA
jgi:hypothetical protein